ncbi:hypothetical protein ANO11243_036340 [Dothideomycetidae sp. 11243]|nr:hypothetical protein ANO11243_036340 [fungal sp. No.11243]
MAGSMGPIAVDRYSEAYLHASSKKESSHSKRRSSTKQHVESYSSSSSSSKYSLAIMASPPSLVPAGYPFQPSVMVTKRHSHSSSHRHHHSSSSSSAGRLITVVTLMSAHHSIPLPNGYLRGPLLVSSVSDLPSDYRCRLHPELRVTALGYTSFPNLSIVHPGEYRLRVSLLRLPKSNSKSRDSETLSYVESGVFQIYCHPTYRGQY